MSIILSASLLAATATLPTCSWDNPGRNVFMGDVVGAVDRYTDIPKDVREALKKRMAKRQYDDVAAIKRDTIQGKRSYTDLREMHFGPGTVCKTISRKKWTDKWEERGLVYCEKGHCIIVPTVCRNVSRVNLKQDDPLEFDTAAGPAKEPDPPAPEPPPLQLPMPTEAPLDFETAAGPQAIPTTTVPPPPPSVPTIPSFTPSIPGFPTITPQSLIEFTTAVPEPSTWALFGLGMLAVALRVGRARATPAPLR